MSNNYKETIRLTLYQLYSKYLSSTMNSQNSYYRVVENTPADAY